MNVLRELGLRQDRFNLEPFAGLEAGKLGWVAGKLDLVASGSRSSEGRMDQWRGSEPRGKLFVFCQRSSNKVGDPCMP